MRCKNCGHSISAYGGGKFAFLHSTSRRMECLVKKKGQKCGCIKPEFDTKELE
jgi:hypothetical protein